MAPIIQVAAAACFAAFCSARTAFAQETKAVAAGDDLYTAINLGRRGKMTVLIPTVTKSDSIVTEVIGALPGLAGANCANADSFSAANAGGFFAGFKGDNPNYAELVQGALTTGLAGIDTEYPTLPWGQGEWSSNNVVANIGFLLNSKSTQVGCAITQQCTETNLLLCRLQPAPVEGEQPFSKEYYSALKARTEKIQDMKPSDINPDGSGATASFPSLLLAGFAGFMALASI